jgi:amino acid transporter
MEKIDYKDELYKASLIAFFKNEADNDKLILGLSIAGIGFFISLIKNMAVINELGVVTFIIALIMFFITSFLIILIFYYNRRQFLNIISSKGDADEDPTLSKLDKVKYIPFLIAVIASAILVFTLIFQQTQGV